MPLIVVHHDISIETFIQIHSIGTEWAVDVGPRVPGLVERCGSVDTVPSAPRNRPLVLLDPEYETNRKFWRASRHRDGIEWTKTTAHFYSEALDGWMRETDKEDAEMWPSASVLWTRGSRPASPKAPKKGKKRRR